MDIQRRRTMTTDADAVQASLRQVDQSLEAMQPFVTERGDPATQVHLGEARRAAEEGRQVGADQHPTDSLSRVLGGLRYKHKHFMVSAGKTGTYRHVSQQDILPAEAAAPVGPQPNLFENLHAVRQGLKNSWAVEVQLGSFDAIPPGVSVFAGAKHRRDLNQYEGEVGLAVPSGEPYGRLGGSRILFKGAQGTFPLEAFDGNIQVHGSLGMRKNDPNEKAHLHIRADLAAQATKFVVADVAVQVRGGTTTTGTTTTVC